MGRLAASRARRLIRRRGGCGTQTPQQQQRCSGCAAPEKLAPRDAPVCCHLERHHAAGDPRARYDERQSPIRARRASNILLDVLFTSKSDSGGSTPCCFNCWPMRPRIAVKRKQAKMS